MNRGCLSFVVALVGTLVVQSVSGGLVASGFGFPFWRGAAVGGGVGLVCGVILGAKAFVGSK